jgi:hypothetical protein
LGGDLLFGNPGSVRGKLRETGDEVVDDLGLALRSFFCGQGLEDAGEFPLDVPRKSHMGIGWIEIADLGKGGRDAGEVRIQTAGDDVLVETLREATRHRASISRAPIGEVHRGSRTSRVVVSDGDGRPEGGAETQ